MDQPPSLCDELTEPALSVLDGNIYVRAETPYAALEEPLVRWVDTNAENCSTTFNTLAEFRDQVSGFEANGQEYEGSARRVFTAPDIHRYSLRRALRVNEGVVMPEAVRGLLGWSPDQAAGSVGANPVQ